MSGSGSTFTKRYGAILRRHDLKRTEPAASPWHGLTLGNGDMGSVIFGPEHALHFRLNKLDLWDPRWPEVPDFELYSLSRIKEVAAEASKHLADGERIEAFDPMPWGKAETPPPCMRTGADLVVCVGPMLRALHPEQRLRLQDATYRCRWETTLFDSAHMQVEAFTCYSRNVLAMRLSAEFGGGHYMTLALRRDPLGGRTDDMLRKGDWGLRGWQDPRDGTLPPAEYRCDGPVAVMTQLIPGDAECDPCTYAVAVCCKGGLEFSPGPAGEPVLDSMGLEAKRVTCFTAMATERDGPDPVDRAIEMARAAAKDGWARLHREHKAAWQDFWSANRVELADRELERRWYRLGYLLGCTAKSGGPAPGLAGVALPYDAPPWRGDRHNNWPEYAGTFWGAYAANHLDIALNYVEHTEAFMPAAREIAREAYECDGAVFPHVYIDYSRRWYFDNLWSRSLYVTAITAQNIWWHYLYSQDRTFLSQRAWPILAEASDFYVSLVSKNPEGDYSLWPTVPPEFRGFIKDLALSRNCVIDLAMVRFLLRASVRASEILGREPERRDRWRDLLDHLPPYPTIQHKGRTLFIDVEGNTEIPPYNHPIGVSPMFPGEDPECFGAGAWREIAEATLKSRDWGDFQQIAYARLGDTKKAYELAQPPRQRRQDYNVDWASSAREAQQIAELLLQSWDGVIRLFPAWPLQIDARFESLRAVGAFLVSAECTDGRIGPITLASEAGQPASIELPWPSAQAVNTASGQAVDATVRDGALSFRTRAGTTYRIEENTVGRRE